MSEIATKRTASSRSTVHVFGVRHHGPGSARSLGKALEALEPDALLVEGPPDADAVIPLLGHAEMRPPVAILVYRPEKPRDSAYYPFAEFSPEWQAIAYALRHSIPVRFMDLPMAHQLGAELGAADEAAKGEEDDQAPARQEDGPTEEQVRANRRIRVDPLQVLAEAAGFGDGERWWEHVVEHRRDGADLFDAIREAMTEVRSSIPRDDDLREQRREAHMRQTIRATIAEGRERIAVVCGAWHAPALVKEGWPAVKEDAALLKGLPKTKVAATWVPWTHGRLAYESGYGAGIQSPGWYQHLWTSKDLIAERWFTKVARLLRDEGLDASSASVIEAVRLAEALAALRSSPLPGLTELSEACRTVFCFGDETPMQLIRRKLIVGEALGRVPDETPMVPLVQDLNRLHKRLKLPPDPAQTTKILDLREANDLERSHLLHRLDLLGVPWGRVTHASGKGTFKEAWQLQWQPEFAVLLIEASVWGSTVLDAASARASDLAASQSDLPALTSLLDRAILADLPSAVEQIMGKLEAEAALSSDVRQMMEALPALANLLRYGNVRKTDAAMVVHATDGLIARVCVGLPSACASLDDPAAEEMLGSLSKANAAIGLISNADHSTAWHGTLAKLSKSDLLHGLIAGRCCRILLDARALEPEEAARRMSLAISTAAEPAHAAAWVDGFLKGSGEVLYYDDALFGLLDEWLRSLSPATFTQLLPLLRRTFSTFEAPLRRNLGEKVRRGAASTTASRRVAPSDFDEARAAKVLPLVARLLGLPHGVDANESTTNPST
jgi:hypothetical protein